VYLEWLELLVHKVLLVNLALVEVEEVEEVVLVMAQREQLA
jgi:hypothetical protein